MASHTKIQTNLESSQREPQMCRQKPDYVAVSINGVSVYTHTHTHTRARTHTHSSRISMLTHGCPNYYYYEFQQSNLKLIFEKISVRQISKSVTIQQEFRQNQHKTK